MGSCFPPWASRTRYMYNSHLCYWLSAWVNSIVVGVSLFIGPVVGGLLNRFGFRAITIGGCLLCSAGLLMGSFVPSIVTLYIAYSLPYAVGTSLVYISAAIIGTHYFTRRRSIALGLITAGPGLGTMICGPALQALVDLFDWSNTFRLFSGLIALASIYGWLLHPGASTPDEHTKASSKKFRLNLSLLKRPNVFVILITFGMFTFLRWVPYVHLVSVSCSRSNSPALDNYND